MDEITFVIRLISDNWSSASSALLSRGDISSSNTNTPLFIDIRSIEPNRGNRVDVDQKAVIVFFEDSASLEYPTIDHVARNETYGLTLHLRVLQRRNDDSTGLTFARDRLKDLYRVVRYILESKSLLPKVTDISDNVEGKASMIKLTGRSEANDRGKRLLGYKMSVELKRFAVCAD